MCRWGTHRIVPVLVHPKDSFTGRKRWKLSKIDSCIARIVAALQRSRINMRGSCCGHGKLPGLIALWDGRGILIVPDWRKARDKSKEIQRILE